MLMVDEPEAAKCLLNRIVDFEMEYYRRLLEAGQGKIDIIRPHDDYGTQISLLFSVDMWREFFRENTKQLTELTHKYNAFYQQHSCGAVRPIIPELINCGVDVLEPLQKVEGAGTTKSLSGIWRKNRIPRRNRHPESSAKRHAGAGSKRSGSLHQFPSP